MPDTKITALTAISTVDPAADPLVIVDVSDTSMAASGTTKKSTINQLLGAGGTATLASATITGDLTVDTSTLKVDSANNRVGIGTASPATILHLQDSSTLYQTIQTASGGAGTIYKRTGSTGATDWLVGHGAASASNKFEIYNSGLSGFEVTSNGQLRYAISTTGVHTWSYVGGVAGDAMTLNSTGLIRGASSADVQTQESTTLTNIGNIGAAYGTNTGTYFAIKVGAANGTVDLKADARTGAYPPITFITGTYERMRIDSVGNVIVNTAAVATTATDGFLYIPGCAGTPTGTPTANTGRVPLVVDTTNNKLYFYSGGAWVAAN